MPFRFRASYKRSTRRWTLKNAVFPSYRFLLDRIQGIFKRVNIFYLIRTTFSPSAGDQQPSPTHSLFRRFVPKWRAKVHVKASHERSARRWTLKNAVFPSYQSFLDRIHRIFKRVNIFYLIRTTFSPSAGDGPTRPLLRRFVPKWHAKAHVKASHERSTRRWTLKNAVFPSYQSLLDQIHRIFKRFNIFYLIRVTFFRSAGDQQPSPTEFVLIADTVNSADERTTTAAARVLGALHRTGMLKFIVNDKLSHKEAPNGGGPSVNSMDVDVEPQFVLLANIVNSADEWITTAATPFLGVSYRNGTLKFIVNEKLPYSTVPIRVGPWANSIDVNVEPHPPLPFPQPIPRGFSLPIPAPRPSAAFVADITIPDGHILPSGAFFVKSWKMLNDGEIPWPAGTHLAFTGGERFRTSSANAERLLVAGLTLPGEMADIRVEFRAPEVPGKYVSYWRLQDEGGRLFGDRLRCNVEVVEPQRAEDANLKTKSSESSLASSSSMIMPVSVLTSEAAGSVVASPIQEPLPSPTLSSFDSDASEIGSIQPDRTPLAPNRPVSPVGNIPDAFNAPSSPAEPVVHPDVICGHCNSKIEGIRYKCNECPDFDICETCMGKNDNDDIIHNVQIDHTFEAIPKPVSPGPTPDPPPDPSMG